MAVLEPNAGFLLASRGVRVQQDLATRYSAELRFEEPALQWGAEGNGVWVKTAKGVYRAERLVIAAGPWSGRVMSDLGLPLTVQRVPNAHFRSNRPDLFSAEVAPIFTLLVPEGQYYAIPGPVEVGFKIGRHDNLETCTPESVRPEVTDGEIAMFRKVMEKYLPGAAGPVVSSLTCLYTMTPDKHFIVDRHPEYEQVAIACGFSGHGYKFAPVIGEILADLAMEGRTAHPAGFLEAGRFLDH